jgi:hypothetical protein
VTRDRCYDFKNIFAEKFGEKFAVFPPTTANFLKIDPRKMPIFSPKIGQNRRNL